jgi:hypothetical protein
MTASTGAHWTATERRKVHRSKPRQYHDTYNPVAGLEPAAETGHKQARRGNTMNNRRNGGGAMFSNPFKDGGLGW